MARMAWVLALALVACGGSGTESELFESTGAEADAGHDAARGADDTDSGSAADGSAGPTDRVCAPGQSVACVGPGGCQGGQACRDDGSGFEPCECAVPDGGDDLPESGVDAAPDAPDSVELDAGADAPAADASPAEPDACEPPGNPGFRRYCTDTCDAPKSGWAACDRVCKGDHNDNTPTVGNSGGGDMSIIFPPVTSANYGCNFCPDGIRWSWTALVNGCARITSSPDRFLSAKPGVLNHVCGEPEGSHCIVIHGGAHVDFARLTVTATAGSPTGWIRVESVPFVDGQCTLTCPSD